MGLIFPRRLKFMVSELSDGQTFGEQLFIIFSLEYSIGYLL